MGYLDSPLRVLLAQAAPLIPGNTSGSRLLPAFLVGIAGLVWLRPWPCFYYTSSVRSSGWHAFVRLSVCVLLLWTTVDLLVPQLCEAESVTQSVGPLQTDSTGGDRDADCFCCSHSVSPVVFAVIFTQRTPVVVDAVLADGPLSGVPDSLYRPPLQS